MMRWRPYTGDLAQHILLPDRTAWHRFAFGKQFITFDSAGRRADERIRRDAEIARLPLLFAHYQIKEGDWEQLAIALARAHVPGFSSRRATGAPTTITADALFRLYKVARRKRFERRQKRTKESSAVSMHDICDDLSAALVDDERKNKKSPFRNELPEMLNVSTKSLKNLLSKANRMRRENVVSRWERRASARRLAEAGIPEDEWEMFDDVPYWPGAPNPFRSEKQSQED